MSAVHDLKTRAKPCASCPFVDGTPREQMEAIAGVPMETLILRDGVVCHEAYHCGAHMQCAAARTWLEQKGNR